MFSGVKAALLRWRAVSVLAWSCFWVASTVGCAASAGWARADRLSCPFEGRRVLCVDASPDLGMTFEIGGEAVLPGECASPEDGAGALVLVRVEGRKQRTVRVPDGAQTDVVLEDGRRFRVRRLRCPS